MRLKKSILWRKTNCGRQSFEPNKRSLVFLIFFVRLFVRDIRPAEGAKKNEKESKRERDRESQRESERDRERDRERQSKNERVIERIVV